MELEDWISSSTCEQFIKDGVIASSCLQEGLFTIGALDNINHDSTTMIQPLKNWEIYYYNVWQKQPLDLSQ